MIHSTVLAIAAPATAAWSLKIAIMMVTCNLFALAIGRYAIQNPGVGPSLPANLPAVFSGFGLAELLAVASFGHILGAGMILGLANAGLL